jgi:hypothetical protein
MDEDELDPWISTSFDNKEEKNNLKEKPATGRRKIERSLPAEREEPQRKKSPESN